METEKLLRIRKALEAAIADAEKLQGAADAAPFDNLRAIICFAIPVYNMIGPLFGLPVLPVPSFCNT